MHKVAFLLLVAVPLTSQAHPGAGPVSFPMHILHHSGDGALLCLFTVALSAWLLFSSRTNSRGATRQRPAQSADRRAPPKANLIP